MNLTHEDTPAAVPDTQEQQEQASSSEFKVQSDKQEKEDVAAQVALPVSEDAAKKTENEEAKPSGVSFSAQTQRHSHNGRLSESSQERHSSLEIRKLPVHDLLMPETNMDDCVEEKPEEEVPAQRRGLIKMTCLNPKLELRTQLMLSFDSVNFITIFLVVLICVVVSLKTGDNIKEINTETFSNLAKSVQGKTARYLAESLEHRIIPRDVVQILYEVTRDRFQGYPTFLDDSQVPFKNMETNESVYPIIGPPLPLDWQLGSLVTTETDQEHVQGRQVWYGDNPLSAANGFFIMQGACDPSQTDPDSRTYWPNCTAASNDISTGGVMRPSNLTSVIHNKASDLVPTMKALYEYNQDIKEIGVYFANQGVGATVSFPHYELSAQNTYTATGCEWMKEPNPYDPSRPIGTQEEIDQCYAEGTVLSSREYSPLGRAWCRDQALDPERIIMDGPFLDAFVDDNWLLSSGRAVYDRITNDFVACIFVGMSTAFVDDIMKESRVTPNSEVSVVRWDPKGSAVASSAGSTTDVQGVTIVDLNVGLTNETYNELYNLVDYDSEWDPLETREDYESFISSSDGFLVAAYPIPPIPNEYDPTYRPVFLAIVSTDESDVFDKVEEVNQDVDDRTNQAMLFAIVAGAIGFVVATIIILITATAITRPLQEMNKEAKLIVGSFGDDGTDVHKVKTPHMNCPRCVPRTELTDVVTEFNKMMSSFSGSLMARTEQGKYVEIMNMFDMRSDFMSLYESRRTSALPLGVVEVAVDPAGENTVAVDEAGSCPFRFVHSGTNLKMSRPPLRKYLSSDDLRKSDGPRKASPLFISIVVLIVTPLLITTITIAAVVLTSMSREFDESVQESEQHYLDVALQALAVYTGLRSDFVSTYTRRSVRDLYLMTRFSSWILFDGIERADSFTETITAVNECLEADDFLTCPWTIENRFCDCSWNYEGEECEDYPEVISRSNMVPYFFVSSDASLPNGTRLTTDFPLNSVSPNTTLWWDGPFDLPGSETNRSTSGLSTTYGRLRAISAFPLFSVLVNYKSENENEKGHFFGFEEDGMWFANRGCDNSEHTFAAFWQSTEENGAASVRPEICPLGKYGYDPRCRGWYDIGKKRAIETGDNLYITVPYLFVQTSTAAQSATSPLIDPRTNAYLGQVLLDFSAIDIFNALTSTRTPLSGGGFPLLITVERTLSEGDTVIGPGFDGSGSAPPVSQIVFPFDQDCQGDESCIARMRKFDTIVESMKGGNSSLSMFERRKSDGGIETVYMASAPVNVGYLDPVDASDFTRGALARKRLTYSLSLAETQQGILEPFAAIEQDMERQIHVAIGILAAVIFVAVMATIGISYLVARSISEPMTCLLELIRLLNRRDVTQEPPEVDQTMGSKEIINVANSMESLYRVVRLANLSFYAGDLEAAYHILVDALRLFRRLDNKKAVGVACNNLGNTMLAVYREMELEGVESKFGISKEDVITRGTAYFHEAIQLGETSYDEFFEVEGWSPSCLDFMQHLSNRYFNRAIFLLIVKKDHPNPEEIETLGYRDLDVARDMDAEIETQGEESGWGSVKRSEKLFNVRLVRLRGYLLLLEMGYPDEWEVEQDLRDIFQMLADEAKKPSSDLFHDVRYIGRLQQVETLLMKYLLIKGESAAAARVAIRMLMEDERVFLDSEARAIKSMQAYLDSSDSDVKDDSREGLMESLEDMLDDLKEYCTSRKQSASTTRSHRIASKSLRNIGDVFATGKPSSSNGTRWSVSDKSDAFVTMEQF